MQTTETKYIPIVVNGEDRSVPGGLSLFQVLRHLGIEPGQVAVEMDRLIVKKSDWTSALVESGAQLEVVQFVGGG